MLCTWLSIEAWLSTAFHPKTDDQTKNTNTIMKQYLWMYCSYLQDDWEKWLSLAEFTANNMTNESTGVISFYATYGQNPWLEFKSQTKIDDHDLMIKWLQQIDANNFADWMNKLTNLLQSEMLYAQALQEYHANKEQMPAYDFKPGDKVYLSTWNLKTKQLTKKLDWKFTEQLTIKQKISFYAYELELPPEQASVTVTTHNCWKWRRPVLCWLDWWHEMKHEVHTIWTPDQMRRIWTKNMRIIHNNKERHTCFDKRISPRSFFTACPSWMSKRRESIIALWYTKHESWRQKDQKKNSILIIIKNHIMKHDANMKILKSSM